MLNPFSFAKCNRHMKHKWGEMSLIVAAALHSLGKLANIFLKDKVSFWPFRIKRGSKNKSMQALVLTIQPQKEK